MLFCLVVSTVALHPVILVHVNHVQGKVNKCVHVGLRSKAVLVLRQFGSVKRYVVFFQSACNSRYVLYFKLFSLLYTILYYAIHQVCGNILSCEHHLCERVCHSGSCGPCPLSESRKCPCGKRSYKVPCTEDILPCGDTCARVLNCGIHTCPERCHRDKCGTVSFSLHLKIRHTRQLLFL